jgi:glycosyltransferase involved in cell wall biosynthesis
MSGLSVLILTLDEEHNLPDCLWSVDWCDDVVVLDSLSTDGTVEVARRCGAKVVQRPFDDFAGQRNFAMRSIDFRHPWVFHLDADERFTPELRAACQAAVAEDLKSAYFVPAKVIFMGRWIRRASLYPSYQVRLVKKGEVGFVQKGHGQQEHDARRGVGMISEPYLHFPFSRGLDEWRERHDRYSSQECAATLAQPAATRLDLAGIVSWNDPVRRRRALKALSSRVPCRGLVRFLYMYVLRLGVLDGRPGLVYCRLMARYEGQIRRKARDARARAARTGSPACGS